MNWFSSLSLRAERSARAGKPTHRTRGARLELERLEDRCVPSSFEVWAIDQMNTRDQNGDGDVTDTTGPVATQDSGGRIFIYQGNTLEGHNTAGATPEVFDLGGNTYHNFMFNATGEAGVRPHMLMFNSTASHAILSFVASGHVLFIDTQTRLPVGVIDVDPQAHAAVPAPDDSYIIVANQNGKLLHRIWTDYRTNTFTLDPVALNLATLEGPGRPDNRPICPLVTSDSRFTFVTLAGGGMFVVDTKSATMKIVADYTSDFIHREGCGGVELDGKMYINAGSSGHSDLYVFKLSDFDSTPNPSNTPAPTLIYSQDGNPTTTQVDAHGVALTKHGRYLWVADRWANKIVVVDTDKDKVVNEIPLTGSLSSDPAPDLLAVSPSGNRMFVTLRGPVPLTANNPTFRNAVGATPGLGIIQVTEGGRNGELIAIAPISHLVGGVERADPHGIGLRLLKGQGAKGHGHAHGLNGSGFDAAALAEAAASMLGKSASKLTLLERLALRETDSPSQSQKTGTSAGKGEIGLKDALFAAIDGRDLRITPELKIEELVRLLFDL